MNATGNATSSKHRSVHNYYRLGPKAVTAIQVQYTLRCSIYGHPSIWFVLKVLPMFTGGGGGGGGLVRRRKLRVFHVVLQRRVGGSSQAKTGGGL